MTSQNICKILEDKDSISYQAICDCVDDKCGHLLTIERDPEFVEPILTIWADVHFTEYFCQGWWRTLLRRLRTAWSIVVHARQDELCCEYIFQGEKHIRDYIRALEEGLERAEVK